MVKTLRFRIKDSSNSKRLEKHSKSVNVVWNYCNETSYNVIRNYGKFLSSFELMKLTSGSSKILQLNSATIQVVCEEYCKKRVRFKKRKLRWRANKKSLGWIPLKADSIQIKNNKIVYLGHKYKIWLSQPVEGKILSGSFSQDARGRWYINLNCEVIKMDNKHQVENVGIDLGLKTSAVLSDGNIIENKSEYKNLEKRLAKAQRAKKKKQIKTIHAKIKNKRIDRLHKETTKIAKKYHTIFVGDVSGKFLQSTNGKSSIDASIGIIRNFLKYKAIRYSGRYIEVSENSSTITCSNCLKKTGPSGLSDLGIREWTCYECRAHHDRDINAAKNILRFGHETLRATNIA